MDGYVRFLAFRADNPMWPFRVALFYSKMRIATPLTTTTSASCFTRFASILNLLHLPHSSSSIIIQRSTFAHAFSCQFVFSLLRAHESSQGNIQHGSRTTKSSRQPTPISLFGTRTSTSTYFCVSLLCPTPPLQCCNVYQHPVVISFSIFPVSIFSSILHFFLRSPPHI